MACMCVVLGRRSNVCKKILIKDVLQIEQYSIDWHKTNSDWDGELSWFNLNDALSSESLLHQRTEFELSPDHKK